jgi:hypothetical protein
MGEKEQREEESHGAGWKDRRIIESGNSKVESLPTFEIALSK